jgi:RNase P subunit RPR2
VLKDYKIFPEVPFCPHCDQPLSVSDVIPTMPIDEDEVVWKCGECGTEVKRVLDRQRSEPVILAQ